MQIKSQKQKHLSWLRQHGRFVIDCETDIFSEDEIELLEKWGHWYRGLCEEKLVPFTMKQENFIRVYKGEIAPFSLHETAWFKYTSERISEEKPGDIKHREYLPQDDPFYNRSMRQQMNRMMFGVMRSNHRRML
jgi:uncharacterized protein YifE (UPF0438 family)